MQDELNKLLGFPVRTETARLENQKDMIDELDKAFAKWDTKTRTKDGKI